MSYTDYLNRHKINSPKVIDTQMRLPDASSFTWRTKMAATSVNRRTDHVINNSQDLGIAPRLFSPQVMGYNGSGFGGKVQDASSYTQSRGSTAIGHDNFTRGRIIVNNIADGTCCNTRPPASQVVSEFGNSDRSLSLADKGWVVPTGVARGAASNMSWKMYAGTGLNMAYTRQNTRTGVVQEFLMCNSDFNPQAKSYFVDTIPDVKFHKSGTAPQPVSTQTAGGRQNVQNAISCVTTNTAGVALNQQKADIPYNSYSALPNNSIGSKPNLVHGRFITAIQGPQTGGGYLPGSRAPIVGGPTPLVKRNINHRGWANPTRSPYPHPRVPPRGAPAQLKINDPNHYKM